MDWARCDIFTLDEAVRILVGLYRRQLEKDPKRVAREWTKQFGGRTEVAIHDEDEVLLVERSQ